MLLALATLGCAQQKIDKKAEGEKVMQASKDWAQIASSKDVEKTVSYWADDAVVISDGQPTLKGKDAIRQMVTESFKTPGFQINWHPQSVEVSESGDMAYLIEHSEISFSDSTGRPVTIINRGVTIWRKQKDGSWKNVVDISTPEAPLVKAE